MREIVIGMIWGLGLMAAMLVTVRLYRGDFNRRHLFLFYGFTGLAGIVLRLFGLVSGLPVDILSVFGMMGIAWVTWRITGETPGRVATVFGLLLIGAAFCEILSGILFFRGPALLIPEIWKSEQMTAAAAFGNVIWVAYLAVTAQLWLQLEKKCTASNGRQVSFLIIVEAVCLILLMTAVYCQALDWNCAVAAGIILQILGTLGFAHLQLKYEEVKNMEEQVKRLELQNQEEYERYVELERKYRQLHQIRHDFNNQLTTAYYLMQAGKEERAFQLLDEMEDMLEGGREGESNKGSVR